MRGNSFFVPAFIERFWKSVMYCWKLSLVLSGPGPEALYRPGQARPTYRAYEGLGPGLAFNQAQALASKVNYNILVPIIVLVSILIFWFSAIIVDSEMSVKLYRYTSPLSTDLHLITIPPSIMAHPVSDDGEEVPIQPI